eukprot:Stramenopile-MAST_4_protein_1606
MPAVVAGRVSDDDREEDLGRVKTEPYTIREFRGNYHVHKIESSRPIAGTQIRQELARIEWRTNHATRMANSICEREETAKRDRELGIKSAKSLQDMRQHYGFGKTCSHVQAIVDARVKEVERMVQSGISKNKTTTKRFWAAVKRSDVHQVSDLIVNKGFEGINVPKSNGETALILAIRNRDIHFTEGLLGLDANPNTKDHAGRPSLLMPWSNFELNPFMRSEMVRKEAEYILEMTLLLLAYNANINVQRFDGNTCLHLATRYNLMNLVIALVRLGADPYIKNVEEENVFEYANKFNRVEIIRVVANYRQVADDIRIDEFTRKWRDFIFAKENKKYPLSITPAVYSLLEEFENTDRAARGQMGNGVRLGNAENAANMVPGLKKSTKMSEAEMTLKLWRTKKIDAKDDRVAQAKMSLPSVIRMSVYKVNKKKKERARIKNIDDDRTVANKMKDRRKEIALCVTSDVKKGNIRGNTKFIRPATASLVFFRGLNPVKNAPVTDPNAARKELEVRQRKEELELMGAVNGKRKEATINPAKILPPSMYSSIKNGPRLKVNTRPLRQTWKSFASANLDSAALAERQKQLPLFGQTLIKREDQAATIKNNKERN